MLAPGSPDRAAVVAAQEAVSNGVPVYANVYHLIPDTAGTVVRGLGTVMDKVSAGLYHVGIEVLGDEWSFGHTPEARHNANIDGMFRLRPRTAPGEFKEQVLLGYMPQGFGAAELRRVVARMQPMWKACTYHILRRNCIHFSREFAATLNPDFERMFPAYVSRAVGVGGMLVPDGLLSTVVDALAPPEAVPEHLIGRIHVAWTAPIPPPGYCRRAPSAAATPPTASKPSWASGLTTWAAAVTASVSSTVSEATREKTRRVLFRAFPELVPVADETTVEAVFQAHVMHAMHECRASIYVLNHSIAIVGEDDAAIAVLFDYATIYSIQYGRRVPASVRGLPPAFELAADAFGGDNAGLLLFPRAPSNAAVPIFWFRDVAAKASTLWASVVEGHARGVSVQAVEDMFDAVDRAWRTSLVARGLAVVEAIPVGALGVDA